VRHALRIGVPVLALATGLGEAAHLPGALAAPAALA